MDRIGTPRQIGAAVRQKRKAMGLTQQQAAAKAGVARSFVNRVEMGASTSVYPEKLLALLAALNLGLVIVDLDADHNESTLDLDPASPSQQLDEETRRLLAQAASSFQLDPTLLDPPPHMAFSRSEGDER